MKTNSVVDEPRTTSRCQTTKLHQFHNPSEFRTTPEWVWGKMSRVQTFNHFVAKWQGILKFAPTIGFQSNLVKITNNAGAIWLLRKSLNLWSITSEKWHIFCSKTVPTPRKRKHKIFFFWWSSLSLLLLKEWAWPPWSTGSPIVLGRESHYKSVTDAGFFVQVSRNHCRWRHLFCAKYFWKNNEIRASSTCQTRGMTTPTSYCS